ncbi:MAG: hypothetical protein IPJ46_08910 [Anaerolineales bacterium]|nr:hypothetical protein [Anaerolineales bacterium]
MPTGSQEFQEIEILRSRTSKLEAHVQFLYKHLGVSFVPETIATDEVEIVAYLRKGDVMGAIRTYPSIHGSDLAEAKAAVDEIRIRTGV